MTALEDSLEASLQTPGNLLQRLQKVDLENARANSMLGTLARGQGVKESMDFFRVRDLPSRDWEEIFTLDLREELSACLREPGGEMVLHASQAGALWEFHELRGLIGAMGVGAGKTPVTYLAPQCMNPPAKRPLLLVPAALREKTYDDFRDLRSHWRPGADITIESYERISRSGDEILEKLQPDLIIADEVTALKNPKAACTRKITRYGGEHRPAFIGLSGTIIERGLHDFWHLLWWALGAEQMPLPTDPNEFKAWSLAIDEGVEPESRMAPGALAKLDPSAAPEKDEDQTDFARRLVGERIRKTPGVIFTSTASCNAPILLSPSVPPHDEVIEEALSRIDLTDPHNFNGARLTRPVDVWRVQQQVSLGFYLKWVPDPPQDWLTARNCWSGFVRETLAHAPIKSKLDSPLNVWQAVKAAKENPYIAKTFKGRKVTQILEDWENVKHSYEYETQPEWLTLDRLHWISQNYLRADDPHVVWVDYPEVGKALSQISGVGFCHRKGLDSEGTRIEKYGGRPVIASIKANKKGRNLQVWDHTFVVNCMAKGADWEQLLGRLHRQGQLADAVYCQYLSTSGNDESFSQACREARLMHGVGRQPQRLCFADYV